MTDQDESRPLSRREIRLREMAAAGVAPEETPVPQEAVAAGDTATDASDDIEISLFDETGRQRSRRELRALREQALAERAAAQQEAASAVEAEPEPEPEMVEPDPAQAEAVEPERDPDPVEVEPEPVEPEPEPAAEGPHVEEAQPELGLPETVAFDVIADQQPEPANDFAALLHEIAAENASALSEAEVFAEPDRGPQPEIAAEPQVQAESEVEPEAQTEPDAPAEPEIQAEPEIEAETVVEAEAAPAAAAEDFEAHDYAAPSQGYSFPDIAPLDEGQSIFDDPALQVMNAQGAQTGPDTGDGRGFDDLITRAVAQEGAASSTSTSALILPSMPETDSLSGPLGETGELFVTGSFELPKSLSETGGHAALHDSVEADPLDELGFAEATPTGMMAPVSASRAVSARSVQGAFVAEATKDKSKMPVVLIATGGVLVLGAAGLIVWAAASGLFG
jgi:hypothetical protein